MLFQTDNNDLVTQGAARGLSLLQPAASSSLRNMLSVLPLNKKAKDGKKKKDKKQEENFIEVCDPKTGVCVRQNRGKHMFNSLVYPDFTPGTCDYCNCERCANLLTSIPFFLAGAHILRKSENQRCRVWGKGVIASGLASMAFHSVLSHERPLFKSVCRRLDYSTVSTACTLATYALRPNMPKPLFLACAAMIPVNPLAVAGANVAILEQTYAKRVMENPSLRPKHALHVASVLGAATAFTIEDYKPDTPLVHATWHCMAALATVTILPLMEQAENGKKGKSL